MFWKKEVERIEIKLMNLEKENEELNRKIELLQELWQAKKENKALKKEKEILESFIKGKEPLKRKH